MKNLLVISFFLISVLSFSQEILLEQNVLEDEKPTLYGPNKKNYYHMYLGAGVLVGKTDKPELEVKSGLQLMYGFRYKRRIASFYAAGFDVSFLMNRFNIQQDSLTIFPYKSINNKAWLTLPAIQGEIYNRFNLNKKRGNHVGTFIDIGGYAQWVYNAKYVMINKFETANQSGAGKTKSINNNLVYTNDFIYGLNFRLGFNKYLIYCSYRLTDVFKKQFIYPELPRINVGIQIGLHK
ncbi:MAG: hypothetical protein J0M08_09515 [Bacteroidetes bacterium]|nr:hypothetical protein [Bacteroidota bacterium]